MNQLAGQELLEAAMERGLDEYVQGSIETTVATVVNLPEDSPAVQLITEMVIRGHVEGYEAARVDRSQSTARIDELGKRLVIARDAFQRSDNELNLLRVELGELRGENQRLRSERDEARGYAAGAES